MTHEDRACCRAMHGTCGEMAKRAVVERSFGRMHTAARGRFTPFSVDSIFVEWLAPAAPSTHSIPPAVFRSPNEHSPPGLLIAKLTVLRI